VNAGGGRKSVFEFDKVQGGGGLHWLGSACPGVYTAACGCNAALQVLGAQAMEEEVFACVQPLLVSVLDGRNVCIFAYGQTGRCAAARATHRVMHTACCVCDAHCMLCV